MPCPWGMAALPKSPSRPHSQPWPQCPLVPPHSLGLELAGRPCSLWEWLCCDTLPPSWPLLVHKPELWQGQTCGPGCPLSSLLQGLTPHSQLGMWPPKGRLRRPGAPQLPGRTMAHPCPGPSPRDNNGRSRSRSRLSSSPPESLEGAGAGGGPWAERQRLPPSPALCLARVASLPPSHLQPPQGREGHSSSILGIQRAPPWLLPGPGAAASRVGSPRCRPAARSPLQLLCVSVCQGIVCEGQTRRGSPTSRASPQHPRCVHGAAAGPGGSSFCSVALGASCPRTGAHQPVSPLLKRRRGARSVSLLGSAWLGRGNP